MTDRYAVDVTAEVDARVVRLAQYTDEVEEFAADAVERAIREGLATEVDRRRVEISVAVENVDEGVDLDGEPCEDADQ